MIKSILLITTLMFSIIQARAQGVDMPVAIDSRIKTYIYSPTEVFPVIIHYGYSMHVDLRPQESVKDIILGDNSDWTIVVKNNRIFIRANETDAHTNMTVITNKDVYEFDLFSRSAEDGIDLDMAYVVRFFYPPDEEELKSVMQFSIGSDQREQDREPDINKILSGDINYDFKVRGDSAIAPIVTFSDGKLTYFKFAKGVIPLIYEVGKENEEKLLDMLEYNGYIIVNSTAPRVILRHKKFKAIVEKYNG